ncbi:hypothetical protein EDD21DRAFT_440956 [Dissophora ornata]|nr:hypothetical protein EDD21DRAFT_440956 [Dissophora ornata]
MRCNNYITWAVLARICKERTGKVKVSWIRGHNGNEWNEKADIAAKNAHQAGESPWQVDPSAQSEFRYSVEMAGETLECDTRHVLKMQTARRWHQRWRAQKRTKKSVPDYDSVDWLGTLSNIHNNNPVHTFYSSQKDTHLRSHRIKKAHGMLPTMDVLHVRRPDLYPDSLCRLCNSATKDNEHVWICPKMRQVQDQMREDGLQLVDHWGRHATAAYNKNRLKQWAKKQIGLSPRPYHWSPVLPSQCKSSLSKVVAWPPTDAT